MTINTLMFVGLHELAHVMSISLGHNKEFTKKMLDNLIDKNK